MGIKQSRHKSVDPNVKLAFYADGSPSGSALMVDVESCFMNGDKSSSTGYVESYNHSTWESDLANRAAGVANDLGGVVVDTPIEESYQRSEYDDGNVHWTHHLKSIEIHVDGKAVAGFDAFLQLGWEQKDS
jgi:hypothetical protein